jgi:hypothetical protein
MNQDFLGHAAEQNSLDRFHPSGTDHDELRLVTDCGIEDGQGRIAMEQFRGEPVATTGILRSIDLDHAATCEA